jgi:D-alanyl-D-alanine carboxypeptidase (penicillin-binding protein 5/6)
MGAPTRDIRNAEAAKLLDWGFANYSLYAYAPSEQGKIKLIGSKNDSVSCRTEGISILVPKGAASRVTVDTELPENVIAPINAGDSIGKLTFSLDGERIGEAQIVSSASADRITFVELLYIMLQRFILW